MASDPHPRIARYLLPIPAATGDTSSKSNNDATVAYDLTGVEAIWKRTDQPPGNPEWSGWWPQLDLEATRRLTRLAAARGRSGSPLTARTAHAEHAHSPATGKGVAPDQRVRPDR